ncbi:ABC-2 transporter permease [Peptococcaceae bacterium]|nr:ABC-2 transporter permease [Peptococcaceae bacterium]
MTHPVLNLVRKDLLLANKPVSWLIIIIYVTSIYVGSIAYIFVLLGDMFVDTFNELIYIIPPILTAAMLWIVVLILEVKEVISNSLPVKRSDIVQASYLMIFMFLTKGLFTSCLLGLLFQFIFTPTTLKFISWTDISVTYILGSIIFSIILPLNFRFIDSKNELLLLIPITLMLTILGSTGFIITLLSLEYAWSLASIITNPTIIGLAFPVTLILLFCSISLSTKIYQKRDL